MRNVKRKPISGYRLHEKSVSGTVFFNESETAARATPFCGTRAEPRMGRQKVWLIVCRRSPFAVAPAFGVL